MKQLIGVLVLVAALAALFAAGWLALHLPQP